MEKLYEIISHHLKQGQSFALATILSHQGSTPRTSGSRMLVFADHQIEGTIGGGLVEARVMDTCVEMLARPGTCLIKDYILNQELKSGLDMVCGGDLRVWIQILVPDPDLIQVYDGLADLEKTGKKGVLVSRLTGHSGGEFTTQKALVLPRGDIIGPNMVPQSLADDIQNNVFPSSVPMIHTCNLEEFIVEPSLTPDTLYIFGAGHVGLQLANMADLLDFPYIVVDDREEFANVQRFPNARAIQVPAQFDRAFTTLEVDGDSIIVIMTRGHLHDQTVLEQALDTKASYIGMIGSNRKRNQVYTNLRAKGISEIALSSVFSPIGLEIHSETPGEIAVSIMAQIIQVRAQTKNQAKDQIKGQVP